VLNNPPVAGFSANKTTVYEDEPISFTDGSTGVVESYAWDVDNDGTVDYTTEDCIHSYSSVGTYSVNLTVENDGGSDTEIKSCYITVLGIPPIADFVANVTNVRVGAVVQFTSSSSGDTISYYWNFGDETTSTEQNPQHTYTESGTYTVTLTVGNAYGEDTKTRTDYINAIQLQVAPVIGWGNPSTYVLDIPDGLNAVQIYAGSRNSFAIQENGTIVAWGSAQFGQLPIPTGLRVTDIDSGYGHIVALCENGTVVAWGYNGYGQCNVPTGLTAKAVTAGWYYSAALKNDGTVIVWGDNTDGVCNIPTELTAKEISGGQFHILAIRENGTVVGWGYNGNGECNIPTELTNVVAVAAGASHSVALKNDGTVVAWGDNEYGQCDIPTGLIATQITADEKHTYILLENGTVLQLSDDTYYTPPPGLIASDISSGDYHCLALGYILPEATFSATPQSGYGPLIVQFLDESTGSPTTWNWIFGDGTTSTEQNPQHTYTESGTYAVALTATNAAGSDTETKTGYIIVGQTPAASFTASPASGTWPLTVQFTDTSTNSPTTWVWDFGDGSSSTIQNPSHTYSIFGTYTVSMVVTNQYGNDSEIKTNYIVVHNETDYYPTGSMNFGVWVPFNDFYLSEFITQDESNGEVTINSVGMINTCINWLLAHTAQFGVLIASLAIVTIVTVKTQSVFALFFSLSLILSNMYAPWCPEEAKLLLWVILAIALIGIILKPIIKKV
jgi:PKD repeat protein